ncbi:MAG: JAB domain-containing protein [Candidatus Krumholzibacteriota bacterium]|nr:JAB domain-containing protein [Candidatus Krumholzibacteriota bacterium]
MYHYLVVYILQDNTLEDIPLTSILKEAGDIIGIDVIDHVILGNDCFYSMKEGGEI